MLLMINACQSTNKFDENTKEPIGKEKSSVSWPTVSKCMWDLEWVSDDEHQASCYDFECNVAQVQVNQYKYQVQAD